MPLNYVIFLFCVAIVLIGIYAVARVHYAKNRLGGDDYITTFVQSRQRKIKASGAKFSINFYLMLLIVCPIALGAVTFFLLKNTVAGIVVGAIGLALPELLVNFSVRGARKKFEENYLYAIEQLGESLRAGESVVQAIDDVIANRIVDDGMRAKFEMISSDLKMGIPIADAFARFAEGTPGRDAKDVALAIDVESQVGGHEAEAIKEISDNIRERINLRKELKSIFAETTTMVLMMSFIPYAVMILMTFSTGSIREYYFASPVRMVLFVALYAAPMIGSSFNRKRLKAITGGVDDL